MKIPPLFYTFDMQLSEYEKIKLTRDYNMLILRLMSNRFQMNFIVFSYELEVYVGQEFFMILEMGIHILRVERRQYSRLPYDPSNDGKQPASNRYRIWRSLVPT